MHLFNPTKTKLKQKTVEGKLSILAFCVALNEIVSKYKALIFWTQESCN